ncbi:MAG: hypothetical protein CO093_10785 [Alphaproteobacteria bacterium CG_4_9_14_3_um_filter_47_13]|nr:MAG: hypothetical protein CO093_10785 [Alphaproteobacteria bacterium CG_4_9_14_3_um_filter_47_13]
MGIWITDENGNQITDKPELDRSEDEGKKPLTPLEIDWLRNHQTELQIIPVEQEREKKPQYIPMHVPFEHPRKPDRPVYH